MATPAKSQEEEGVASATKEEDEEEEDEEEEHRARYEKENAAARAWEVLKALKPELAEGSALCLTRRGSEEDPEYRWGKAEEASQSTGSPDEGYERTPE